MRAFLLFICLLSVHYAIAANTVPALEREITLSLSNEKLNVALNKIQEQTGLIFSYPSSILSNAPAVSVKLKQKTVREALMLMLPRGIAFKAKNNYIILKEKPVEDYPKKKELSGYVYDKSTEKKLANVTIYDKNTLESVTTNDYGYYSLSVPNLNQDIVINKEKYKDTSVVLSEIIKENNLTIIRLEPVKDSIRQDSAIWREKLKDFSAYTVSLFKKFKGYVNTLNVQDTLSRNVQVSLLPFIGTNHKLSGSIYNNYSFNIIGGYTRGVNGFEMGSIFNITKENMSGVQLAGFFNLVGRDVSGAQLAGFFNAVGGRQTGVQAAGFINMNNGPVDGVNLAGWMNINRSTAYGSQLAGWMNVNLSTFSGFSGAGVVNMTRGKVSGAQVAGLCNLVSDTLQGASIAGLFTACRYSDEGVQVAGLFNHCYEGRSSVQVAGLFNYSRELRGIQVAPFNFSDSAAGGIPVGVFSFVKKGVHQLELSSDELFSANAAFRTGVPAFYNIFTAGVQPGAGDLLWTVGYGLGTSFKLKGRLRSDITLSTQHISRGGFYDTTSELYKAYWGVEYRFKKSFAIAAGPVFNLYHNNTLSPDYSGNYDNIPPYIFSEHTFKGGSNISYWLGGKIAIRLF